MGPLVSCDKKMRVGGAKPTYISKLGDYNELPVVYALVIGF
jgi:hypothetical protein